MTTDDTTGTPPELNAVLLIHATLRQGADDLYAATDRFGVTTNDPAALTRLWGFYSDHLRRHHQGEDDVIFPLTASRVPDFADVESQLRVEHEAIDELLARADAAFNGLQADPTAARAQQAHGVIGELKDALTNHLAHEERDALGVVMSAIPGDEMAKIEKGFLRETPRRMLGLQLAAMDAATKQHPELHLPPVPKPVLALLALVWRRQYASLVRRAGA
jgi:hemerythrin-like domain-containing protein